jgi:hypothetical protein
MISRYTASPTAGTDLPALVSTQPDAAAVSSCWKRTLNGFADRDESSRDRSNLGLNRANGPS